MRTLGWIKGFVAIATFAMVGTGCATNESSSAPSDRGDRMAERGGSSPARQASGTRDGGADSVSVGNGMRRSTLAFPTGDRATSVVLLEATGPEQVRLGTPYNYTLRVTNLTDAPLHDVRIDAVSRAIEANSPGTTRPAAGGGRMAAATTRPAMAAGAGGGEARLAAARPSDPNATDVPAARPLEVWDVGLVNGKQTLERRLTATADELGSVGSCLTVSYKPSLCVAVQVVQPALSVTKEGPAQALICQDLTYTYRVTNTGTGAVQGVQLTDALPEGLSTPDGGRTFTSNIGDLRQGETKTATAKVRAARTGQFASRATARAAGDVTAQSREVTTAVREPALAVAVEGPEAQYVGQAINYRVTVRNTSDVPAENVVVALSAVGGTERIADRTIGTLEAGGSRNFAVNIGAGRGAGNASLTASARADCARPAQSSASVSILTIPALQLECVDGQDPVTVGQNTTYTITVRNEGSGADQDITLKGVLPAELQFVRGGGASTVAADGQNLTFAPVATLAAGQTATWTIEVKALRPGDVRFYTEMTSKSLSRPAAETEPTRITTGDAAKDAQQGAPVVPQGGGGPAPAGERPSGQQNQPNK